MVGAVVVGAAVVGAAVVGAAVVGAAVVGAVVAGTAGVGAAVGGAAMVDSNEGSLCYSYISVVGDSFTSYIQGIGRVACSNSYRHT